RTSLDICRRALHDALPSFVADRRRFIGVFAAKILPRFSGERAVRAFRTTGADRDGVLGRRRSEERFVANAPELIDDVVRFIVWQDRKSTRLNSSHVKNSHP